ncbi:peptidase S53 [Mycobacterium sp. ACS1612]|uniref:S53 family peptidase n=1 Tax=Mycobacterium sp. ACS1612 TaxID=1834117 RepID=UPI000800F79F|nr:S53 family peptidase [Mycobacterium sp. ACS1612]OBF28215.1 peptidase S53 [Mycobacterium sp. ACS1612]
MFRPASIPVSTTFRKRRIQVRHRLLAIVAAGVLVLATGVYTRIPDQQPGIRGPMALLLTSSTDLGPSRDGSVQLTAALSDPVRPAALFDWAGAQRVSVRWRPGDAWAVIEGAAQDVASALRVPVHDYRGRKGQVFYASPQQPAVPEPVRGVVSELGRILGYTPHREASPGVLPLDVPTGGLGPKALLEAYNANPLAAAGFTGKGETIVFFEFSGYDQKDLDAFADSSGLPRFTPVLVGGQPGPSGAETVMDLEVAHAIAPGATKVVVNARPTVEGDGAYEKIGQLFESVDRQFPGAVWSLSIGWGCDALLKAADLAPVEGALATAQKHGTSAFDASGDTAGLECKGGDEWASPPGADDIGLDAISSLPAMTSVGGTTLSTDQNGGWMGERAWVDSPLSQGTSGGVSALFNRPAWQRDLSMERDIKQRRLAPDVSAVADPFTGVRIVFNQQDAVGAGTSQAAPIWAALTVLMNQYLVANGGQKLGNINPLLYRVAAGANRPAFRDISFGGNAVDLSQPGYDMVTGLGSPNVDYLVRDLLDIQSGVAPR